MIHRVHVRGFKSIVDVAVDFSPVTVLVGKSGTGKSNFVHALRFLRDLLSSPQSQQFIQQHWSQIRSAMATGGPTGFVVDFVIPGIEEKFRYDLSFSERSSEPRCWFRKFTARQGSY